MARFFKRLTQSQLEAKIKAANDQNGTVNIACGDNLYLRVTGEKRNCYWYYRDSADNKQKFTKIGSYKDESLAAVRLRLTMSREQGKEQNSPFSPESKKSRIVTFGEIADKWLELKKPLKHYINYRRCVDNLSALRDVPVTEIRNLKVKETLQALDTSPYMMRETLGVAIGIMDLAVVYEYIDTHKLDLLKKTGIMPKVKAPEHYAYQPLERFPELFSRFVNLKPMLQCFYVLQALTCLRPGEVRQMQQGWVDFDAQVILIPGSVMKVKSKDPFRVPLMPETAKVLQTAIDLNPDATYIFPASRDKTKPIREPSITEPFRICAGDLAVPHGFRSSARSYFEESGVSKAVSEMCLDHRPRSQLEQVYQRSDLLELRRNVMKMWAHEVVSRLPPAVLKTVGLK